MRLPILALVTAALLLVPVAAPAADRPQEPLVEQVRKSIKQGKAYLVKQQTRDGDWEKEAFSTGRPGGCTALALLALLNTREPLDNQDYSAEKMDEVIRKGLEYLRNKVPLKDTYVVGLQTMVYCLAGEDKQRIEANVKWLLDTRRAEGKKLYGWAYDTHGGRPDASNSQYALLGLHEAQLAGVKIDPDVWDSIRQYYLDTQVGGAYGYQFNWASRTIGDDGRPRFTMTTAGLCGLLIAGSELNTAREKSLGNGTWDNCGVYKENQAVADALKWLAGHYPSGDNLASEPHLFYALYGIERAGRLSGLRFIGDHDWYREGCSYLVGEQNAEGAWRSPREGIGPIISTSFALLFLSKGRTPILVSKLTHDGVGLGADGGKVRIRVKSEQADWNNDRNDARHLVDFTARELFKRKPMGWQVFNAGDSDEKVDGLTAELLQSPVAYFNGHLAPEFTGKEDDMLRQYVRSGGVIFAEACCGSKQFDKGFRDLMDRLFPNLPLTELGADHAVWTASGKFAVGPREQKRFPLYGIQMGCKTVVIYSPNDLSCHWESNRFDDKGDTQTAFRIGANVIAYATGLEPPKPRLTPMDVTPDESKEPRKVPRGFLKVGELKHAGDTQAAREAMPNLLLELRKTSGLDVAVKTDEVFPTAAEVLDYKFLYLHGRKGFDLPKDRLGHLRFNLEHGALLFADACCGSPSFDKSFRTLIGDLWPDGKRKLEAIPLKDDLYGKELNGTAVTSVRCRRENAGKRDVEYQNYEPALEGVKVGGRWVVIYSRWDVGCALEKHKSPDCMGHDYDSAVRLGRAAVLYHLR